MALYPDDPRPLYPYPFRNNRPAVGGGPEWAPQIRPLTRFGLAEADLTYHGKTWAQIAVLYNFFEQVGGPGGRFTFVDFVGAGRVNGVQPGVQWENLYVAKADGFTYEWDPPTFGTVAGTISITDIMYDTPLVFENGVAKNCDIYTTTPNRAKPYHLKVGAGTDGIDLLTADAAHTTVATAPSPADSGTSLVVATGDGTYFPTTPFYANIWPTDTPPTADNIETVQVTGVTGDTLTIVRAQNGTVARTVVVGDQVAVPPAKDVIITITATCRRAFRRARFMNTKNPFTLEVVSNFGQSQVTIVEVRK